MDTKTSSYGKRRFWKWAAASIMVRLVLIYHSKTLNLAARPELSTSDQYPAIYSFEFLLPAVAEGYWLKQAIYVSWIPFASSIFGPFTVESVKGLPVILSAEIIHFGVIAALIYLWNPMTILTCVGSSITPIENLIVILTLYGASTKRAPLAAFGWVIATHLSLYPAVLIIPAMVQMLPLGKFFVRNGLLLDQDTNSNKKDAATKSENRGAFLWKSFMHFFLWVCAWSFYILILCGFYVRKHGGLLNMFKRNFFLTVFHMNILFMILPLAIRLNDRPCFLAFVFITIYSVLKSYSSVGGSALYLGLLGLFINELANVKFSFFLICGYVGVNLLIPVMHNLWLWRGIGNANFYFATAMAYTCFQIILLVETVNSMIRHDRKLEKLVATQL